MGSAAILYVTFHGGQAGASSSSPIDTVKGLDADGNVCADDAIEPSGGVTLDELRGLCPAADGGLYVCVANKAQSQILKYGAADADGLNRPFDTVVAQHVDHHGPMAALMHPYGIALSGGNLFVSDQDSGFVSWFSIDSEGQAVPQPTSHHLAKHYPDGKFPDGSFVGCMAPPHHWQAVKADEGGLGLTTSPKKHSVRGFAFAGSTLYVADEVNDRIAAYDAKTGKFLSDQVIAGHGLKEPVGLALNTAGTLLYIGSTGTEVAGCAEKGAVYSCTPGQPGTLAQVGPVASPSGLTFAGGTLYVASRKTFAILTLSGSAFVPFATGLADEPECLLGLG